MCDKRVENTFAWCGPWPFLFVLWCLNLAQGSWLEGWFQGCFRCPPRARRAAHPQVRNAPQCTTPAIISIAITAHHTSGKARFHKKILNETGNVKQGMPCLPSRRPDPSPRSRQNPQQPIQTEPYLPAGLASKASILAKWLRYTTTAESRLRNNQTLATINANPAG